MTASRWTPQRVKELRRHAAARYPASSIASVMGETVYSVVRKCNVLKIDLVRFTPEEQAEHIEMKRRWERNREERKRKRRKAQAQASNVISFRPGTSRTSPIYRNMLGPAPEMTKNQLREELRQAVINTARMQA